MKNAGKILLGVAATVGAAAAATAATATIVKKKKAAAQTAPEDAVTCTVEEAEETVVDFVEADAETEKASVENESSGE